MSLKGSTWAPNRFLGGKFLLSTSYVHILRDPQAPGLFLDEGVWAVAADTSALGLWGLRC